MNVHSEEMSLSAGASEKTVTTHMRSMKWILETFPV